MDANLFWVKLEMGFFWWVLEVSLRFIDGYICNGGWLIFYLGLIGGKMADFGFLLASWVACLWLWKFWVYDFMGMKFSKFMGCYDFLGLWGFYEFFLFLEFSGLFVWSCVVNWSSFLLLHLWKCLGWWQEIVVGSFFFFFF